MRVAATCAALLVSTAAWAQTDPAVAGQWSPLVDWGMTATHAHLLPEGKVMWWPEFTDGNNPTLWDPVTETNTPLPFASYNIFCSGHGFGPDGRLFVFGGHITDGVGFAFASVFDPPTRTWVHLQDMNNGRWYPSVSTLPNGDMFVIAGTINLTVGENPTPQVFQQATSSWRTLSNINVQIPIYPWTFVAPSGEVFLAGTNRTSRFVNTTGAGSIRNGPQNHYPDTRTYGSAVMYEPGKVVIAGGGPLEVVPTNGREVINLNDAVPAWRPVAPLRTPRRQLNMTLLPDGTVLTTGGHSAVGRDTPTSAVLEVELWNPATETSTFLAPMGAYRGYHSVAVLLPDGRVLSAGSTGVKTAQVFSPPYLFRGPRPTISSAPADIAYGQDVAIDTPDAARIGQVTMVRLTSVTHSFNMNQRFNRLTFTATANAVTAHAPDRPEIAPPGHYLLFVLDGSGVPSVGKIVHLGGTAAPPPPPPPPPPPGTIAFRGASTRSYPSGSTSTMTAVIPARAAVGDLLVASVGFGNSGATALPSLSAPPGWTLVRRVDHLTVNSLSVYTHVHAAGEAAPVWTASTSVGGDVSISAYAGAGSNAVDVTAGKDSGAASSYTAPTVVTTGSNELLLAGFFAHATAGIPTTWSVKAPLTLRSSVNNGGSRSVMTADAVQAAPGPSAAFVATASTPQDYALSYVLALVPAGPAAPPPDDFSITATPATVTSDPGIDAFSSVAIAPSGSFSGVVSLSVSGNPAGSTAALDPPSLPVGPASGAATLTLSPGTAPPGTYRVTVTATSGTFTHSAVVSYTISPPPPPPPPPGSIVFRGSSTRSYPSSATTVLTTAIPAGAVAGDLLLASVGFGQSGAVTLPSISTPPGWTLVRRVDHGTVNSLAVYWHVFSSGDAAPSWTTSQSVGGDVSISAYGSVSGVPVDVSAGKDAGAASSFTAPAVVTSHPDETIVAGFFAHSNAGVPSTWTWPAQLTERTDVNNGGSRSLTTADGVQTAAGTSTPFAVNASHLQDYALAYVLALNPAAPPAPAPDDFSVAASPASVTSTPGTDAASTLTITPSGAFSGTVSLSVSGSPAGSTATVDPASVIVGPAAATATLTLSPGTAPPGTYSITITAVSDTLTHVATVSYFIAPPP
ncbi:MAG: galactose oxidase-like domain-containing protein, partial [Myxococcales bacterium]